MNFQPTHDNILVRRPAGMYNSVLKCEALAVGPGRIDAGGTLRKVYVEVGDVILFHLGDTTKFMLDGEEYLLLSYPDVCGVITGERDEQNGPST